MDIHYGIPQISVNGIPETIFQWREKKPAEAGWFIGARDRSEVLELIERSPDSPIKRFSRPE